MIRLYRTAGRTIQKAESLDEKNLWIDLIHPTQDEIALISEKFDVDPDLIIAPLDQEERPRLEAYDGQVLVLIGTPQFREEEPQILYNTLPLAIIITERVLITVCLKKSALVDEIIRSKNPPDINKRTRLVLQLLYNNARQFLTFLTDINKRSNAIEQHLHKSMRNEELIKLLGLEKSLVYFTTTLRSNEIVLEKLLRNYLRKIHDEESEVTIRVLKKYEEDEELLEDVITENKQAMEMGDIYANILSGTMDAFASIISNNLNIVMKFLAMLTIIMAVPTIVTSFFGMNVTLPLQGWPYASLAVIGITVGLMLIGAFAINRLNRFK